MLFRIRSQQATTSNASAQCKSMIKSQVDHKLTQAFGEIVRKFKLSTREQESLHIITGDVVVMDTEVFKQLIHISASSNNEDYANLLMRQFKDSVEENELYRFIVDEFAKAQYEKNFPTIKQEQQ